MNAPETAASMAAPNPMLYLGLHVLAPSPTNPRRSFPDDQLAELAESLKSHGVLQPIIVRPWPVAAINPPAAGVQFEIVSGERRYRASKLAGLASIPALLRDLTDAQVIEIQIIENLQRQDIHPLEEAEGYALLMKISKLTADEVAAKIGKSRAYVYARLKLLDIKGKGRQAFLDGKLSASTALLIARIPVPRLQDEAARQIINWRGNEPASHREAAEFLQREYMLRLADAPFPRGDAELVPAAGKCNECPKRTGNQPELFADVKSADVCTDPPCFTAKREAWKAIQIAQAKASGQKVITGKEAQKIAPYGVHDYTSELQGGYVPMHAEVWQAPQGKGGRHPTWEKLLGDDFQPVLVEDTRSGKLVKVALARDLQKAAAAKGIDLKSKPGSDTNNEMREREKKAKAENAWRETVLQRIIAKQAGEDLTADQLRLLCAELWSRTAHESQKILCRVFNGKTAPEAIEAMGESIARAEAADINRLLLAMALVGQVHVYSLSPIRKPEALLGVAKALDIDANAIKREMARQAARPRTKKQTAAEAQAAAEQKPATVHAVGDHVQIRADAKGPNGKARKSCGRVGQIEAIEEGGEFFTVRFGPGKTEFVTRLRADEFDKVEDEA